MVHISRPAVVGGAVMTTELPITPAQLRRHATSGATVRPWDTRPATVQADAQVALRLAEALRRRPPSEQWRREVARLWALGVRGAIG